MISSFATSDDLATIRTVAEIAPWRTLRNHYRHCKLQVGATVALAQLEARAHGLLDGQEGDALDSFLLDYGHGHFIGEHTDSDNVLRLNLLVIAPHADVDGLRFKGDLVGLRAGDAVIFDPSTVRHSVDPVIHRRLIWSYGIARRATRKTFVPIENTGGK